MSIIVFKDQPLTKAQFITKLHKKYKLDKTDFITMDTIYFHEARDLKAIIDFPIYNAHTCKDFNFLAKYFLQRCHNLRLLLQAIAGLHCIKYDFEPVWNENFKVDPTVWVEIQSIEKYTQDPSDFYFDESAEARTILRQMLASVFLLLKEFEGLYVYYHPSCLEEANTIIKFANVEQVGHHKKPCKNPACQF